MTWVLTAAKPEDVVKEIAAFFEDQARQFERDARRARLKGEIARNEQMARYCRSMSKTWAEVVIVQPGEPGSRRTG